MRDEVPLVAPVLAQVSTNHSPVLRDVHRNLLCLESPLFSLGDKYLTGWPLFAPRTRRPVGSFHHPD